MSLFKKELSDEEKRKRILKKCAEVLAQCLQEEVPATGKFEKQDCSFPIHGTNNVGYAAITVWLLDPNKRGLQFGAMRRGTDMLVSNYVITGTNEELLAYLTDPETQKDWQKRIMELSDSVDDKWD